MIREIFPTVSPSFRNIKQTCGFPMPEGCMNGFLMQEKKIQYQEHCLILDTFRDRYADTYQFLLYNVCCPSCCTPHFPMAIFFISSPIGEGLRRFPAPPEWACDTAEINKTAQDFCLSHTATKVQQQTQIYLNLPCG